MITKFQVHLQHGYSHMRTGASRFWRRSRDMISINWHLGFTAFGGPAVHFTVFHELFVGKHKWIDEQFYQEIFAISQALPGPASTKMLFCINYSRGGLLAAFCVFMMWSLPGAIGMYGLSLGVSHVGETLPAPVSALLSGLNAATVGIIIFAAVQLAKKTITDKITRVLVFLGAAFGTLYTALWFFPVILLCAGLTTVVWDSAWMQRMVQQLRKRRAMDQWTDQENFESETDANAMEMSNNNNPSSRVPRETTDEDVERSASLGLVTTMENGSTSFSEETAGMLSWTIGIFVIIGFMITFVAIMILRGLLTSPPRGYSLFANLYLAGTIIFGGAPVVVPLLRDHIVGEGWVSPRDFILGLAVIQSIPGPNFNFAVYLGSLATAGSSVASFEGALMAFVGIFAPGIIIQTGIMGMWKVLRSRRWFLCLLRGVNATAVGFIYTAVYKLWRTGFIDEDNQTGSSLGKDPWWVVITATSFVGGAWFGLKAPLAILLGAVMGLIWFAVVKTS